MTTLNQIAAGEAAVDVKDGVLEAVREAMAKHGHDPMALEIVASGLYLAVEDLGKDHGRMLGLMLAIYLCTPRKP